MASPTFFATPPHPTGDPDSDGVGVLERYEVTAG